MIRLFLAPLFLFTTTPALAADCQQFEVSVSQVGGGTYDPASVSRGLVQIAIRPTEPNPADDCARRTITIQPRNGSGDVQLRRAGTVLQTLQPNSNVTSNVSRSGVEVNGNGRNQLVRNGALQLDLLELVPGQFVPAGEYLADLEVLVDGRDPRPFQVVVNVDFSIRFEGETLRALSLGEVSDGGEARATFFYSTNASVKVTARSDNGGQLLHEQGRAFGAIPYTASLSGAALDLTGSTATPVSVQPSARQSSELVVSVAPQREAFAGTYRDILTLEFTSY